MQPRPLAGQPPVCRAPAGGEQASGSPVSARRACRADISESRIPGALVAYDGASLDLALAAAYQQGTLLQLTRPVSDRLHMARRPPVRPRPCPVRLVKLTSGLR
jgi:hypothetical protein